MFKAEQQDNLTAKLDQIEARYSEIETHLAEPLFARDSAKLVALSKEQGKLKTIVAKYRQFKKLHADIEQAEQILADSSADHDFNWPGHRFETDSFADIGMALLINCRNDIKLAGFGR